MSDEPIPPPTTDATPPPTTKRRRRLWLRVLLGIVSFVVLLLLAIAGFIYYALDTQDGLRFALRQAERFTRGAIQVGQADGRLLGELDLRDIRYAGSDGTLITIKHAHLSYEPHALWARRFSIRAFDVDTLDYTPGPATKPIEPKPASSLPSRLPVDVIVDTLVLNGFTLHPAPDSPPDKPGGEPFVIEHAEFKGQWIGDTIDVERLAASLAQTGPVQISARAQMSSDHIDFEKLLVQGPGEISARGRVGIGEAKSDLSLEFQQLHWPLVLEDKQPAQVGDIHGGLKVSGTTAHYEFDLDTNATLQGRAARLATKGSGSLQDAQIDQLKLDTLAGDDSSATGKKNGTAAAATVQRIAAGKAPKDAPKNTPKNTLKPVKIAATQGSISASGHVAWAPQIKAELKAVLTHIDPSLFAVGVPGDINGRLDTNTVVAGEYPDIRFIADITRSSLRGQPFSLKAEGSTDTHRAKLKDLLLLAGDGRIEAQGDVIWTPRLSANVDATIAKLNPALVAADWPGEINGALKIRTANEARAPIAIDARISDSKLRGYPLKLDAQATIAGVGNNPGKGKDGGEVVTVQQLDLRSGASRLTLSGQVTPPFDTAGRFESPDLAALYPKLAGRAAFDFKLAGTIETPHVVTNGDASMIRYGDQTVAKLVWMADVDPTVDSKINVTLTEADVGLLVHSLVLSVTGLEVYHHVELLAETERGKANIALQGGFDRKRGEWGGELVALGFTPDGFAPWSLDKGAGLLIGKSRRALEQACLQGVEGRACFNLEQNVLSDGTRIGWNIERLLLHALQPLLPPDYRISGAVDGEGNVNFTGGDIANAMAVLNLRDTRLEVPEAPPFVLETGTVRADQTNGRLHGIAELKTEHGGLNADVSAAPGSNFSERALSGDIRIDFPSLAFLEPLLPQLRSLDGKLDGAFKVAGTPKRPRFEGQMLLADAHAKLVVAGIEVKDVQFKLVSNGNGPVNLDGILSSGGGSVHVFGNIDPFATPLLADIGIKGDQFQVMNTAQARAWASPDLHLVRDAKGATLEGQLVVPRADITPKGFGGGGVEVSSDQVLVGADAPSPQASLPVYADLKLMLGDAVRIEGFGLKTRIEGAVTVTQEPKRGALGRGELRLIDGHYKAYGQDLNIETGRLLFTGGPVTTPAVDLYATRKPREDITVGVRVRGTLAKPELTLQSSPTLPREQQLSWLILGRSLETSSSQDRSLVSSAALSLGLGGGDYLAGLLGKKIGLDQLSVGGATGGGSEVAANAQSISGSQSGGAVDAGAQAAQLTLGKYLTPRLFVSYGISLFQQGYTVRLLYTLGHGFKLSTETGTASGGDLIYQTERGKRKAPPPGAAPATSAEPSPDAPLKAPGVAPAIEPTPAEKAPDDAVPK